MFGFIILELIPIFIKNVYTTTIIFATLLTFLIILGLTAPVEKKTFPPLPPRITESVGTQTTKADINYIIN